MLSSKEEDLERLAETCLSTAKQIKEYLATNNHPPMSFDQNGPSFFPPAPPEIQMTRIELRTAARRLYDLASEPEEYLTWYSYHIIHDLNAFRYVHKYQVHTAVPHDAAISYTDLAAKLAVDASQLKQMLHQLMTLRIFAEPAPGMVAHTCSSRLLSHWGVGNYNHFMVEDVFPMAAQQIETIEQWGHGRQDPNKAAFNFYHHTDLPMYSYYESQPELRDRFSRLLHYVSGHPVMSVGHVARGFDWQSLPKGSVVVDVAGNLGHVSVAVAQANPDLQIIVQDLPNLVAKARDPSTGVVPESLQSTITFMEHDFNTPQPIKHAAVYLMRMIMHDYSDDFAARILRQIVPSMGPNSRIILVDSIMPPVVGVTPEPIERMIRTMDLQMLLLTNAKERDPAEWATLIDRAGEGLVDGAVAGEGGGTGTGTGTTKKKLGILKMHTPPGSSLGMVEVGFVDHVNGEKRVAAA